VSLHALPPIRAADELCTGKRPFTGSNQGELLAAIIKGTYAPLPTEYSGELAALLTAMLNKNAAERPTAVELLASEWARHAHRVRFC